LYVGILFSAAEEEAEKETDETTEEKKEEKKEQKVRKGMYFFKIWHTNIYSSLQR
jgi:hypothetical protein